MKTLYLMRHAKSSWKDTSIIDFDRPLNKRGLHDAPLIGSLLKSKKINIELIISSPAKRAKETAKILANELVFKGYIIFDEEIYEATLDQLISKIKNLDENINRVMLIGHNPGLTNLANYLSKEFITNIPTCGVVALTIEKSWKNIVAKDCEIIFFEYPKKN